MSPIRYCPLAVALALATAVPANAGWWQSGGASAATTGGVATGQHPARATRPSAVPEPADFALFAAGVVGLLLGRRGSRSRRD